tara:strand:- start:571 stop:963 length:393 start_codon:yes stop_codon:yes gene_type:complete
MQMNRKINLPSNRNFGIVFFIVFFVIALWPMLNQNEIRLWSLFFAIIFLILGLVNSNLLTPLNKAWFKFGITLGKFVSPLVMGIIFFLVITPTGILLKLFGKDILNLKKNDNKSYWIKKEKINSSMKKQF